MAVPWLFFLNSPMKVGLWIGHRLATSTGLLLIWRRLKGTPNRMRKFLVWLVVVNAVSLLCLVGVLWCVWRYGGNSGSL